jgi:hypothetical protein
VCQVIHQISAVEKKISSSCKSKTHFVVSLAQSANQAVE